MQSCYIYIFYYRFVDRLLGSIVVRLIVLANVLKTSAALCVRKHSFSSIIVSPSSSSSSLSSDRRLKFVGRCGSLAVVVVIIVLHRSFWLALVAGHSLPGSDDDNVGDEDSAGNRGRLIVQLAVVVVGVDRLRDDRCDDDWDGSFSFSFSSENANTGELPNDFSNCRCGATSRDVLADRVADDGSVVGFSGGCSGGGFVVLGVASVVVVVVVVNAQSGLVVGVDLAFRNTDARVLDVASIKVGDSSSTSGELMGVASVMDRSGTSSNTSSSSSSSASTCSFAVFV